MAAWWWALSFHNSANTNIVFDEPCLNSYDVPSSIRCYFSCTLALSLLDWDFFLCFCSSDAVDAIACSFVSIAFSFILSSLEFFGTIFFLFRLICVFHLAKIAELYCAMFSHSMATNGQEKKHAKLMSERARTHKTIKHWERQDKQKKQQQRRYFDSNGKELEPKTNWMENDADADTDAFPCKIILPRKRKEKWENILLLCSLCS